MERGRPRTTLSRWSGSTAKTLWNLYSDDTLYRSEGSAVSFDSPNAGRVLTNVHQILIHKLREHSRLTGEDIDEICSLSYTTKELKPSEDLIRQGDDPSVSALVLSGLVARYHLLQNGGRQYLSFHMAGDMPDSQSLFIDQMDHAVCAIGTALVASLPHRELLALFKRRPSV